MRFLQAIIQSLPALVAICYLLILLPRVEKNRREWTLIGYLTLVALCCVNLGYSVGPLQPHITIPLSEVINAYLVPAFAPMTMLLLISLLDKKKNMSYWTWLFAIPVATGTAATVLYLISQTNSEVDLLSDLHRLNTILPYIVAAEYLPILIVTILWSIRHLHYHKDLSRFFLHGEAIRPYLLYSLLIFLQVIIGLVLLTIPLSSPQAIQIIQTPITLLLTLCLHWTGYAGLMLQADSYTLNELLHLQLGYNKDTWSEALLQPDSAPAIAPADSAPQSASSSRLEKRIRHRVEEKKRYLQPYYSIEDLSRELGVSRVHLSRVINQTMHTNFRNYLGELRIRHAEEYMLQHPEDTLEQIAGATGFIDAPALCKKFKELRGKTIREWRKQTI